MDGNVDEYLKLSQQAEDRQQQTRIKQLFEKKNQVKYLLQYFFRQHKYVHAHINDVSGTEICPDHRAATEKVGRVPQKGFGAAGEGSAAEVVTQAGRRSQERWWQHPRRCRECHIKAQGACLET